MKEIFLTDNETNEFYELLNLYSANSLLITWLSSKLFFCHDKTSNFLKLDQLDKNKIISLIDELKLNKMKNIKNKLING